MWSVYFKVPGYTSILKSSTFVLRVMQIIYVNMGLEKSKRAYPALLTAVIQREGVWVTGDFHFLSLFYTSLL